MKFLPLSFLCSLIKITTLEEEINEGIGCNDFVLDTIIFKSWWIYSDQLTVYKLLVTVMWCEAHCIFNGFILQIAQNVHEYSCIIHLHCLLVVYLCKCFSVFKYFNILITERYVNWNHHLRNYEWLYGGDNGDLILYRQIYIPCENITVIGKF